jgi:5'(3')-deoxyribonucleotidase
MATMQHLIIAIDCDDVLVPTATAILAHYNKTYGANITLPQLYSKDPAVWKVDDYADAVKRVQAYLNTPEYLNLPPFKEAIDVLAKLSKRYEIHVVTARHDALAEATKRVLAEHFPDVFRSIEFTNHFGATARTKAQVCQEIGADLLIDDHLTHAEAVAQCGINVLLFGDYPWNQAETLHENVERVRDWDEVAQRLL